MIKLLNDYYKVRRRLELLLEGYNDEKKHCRKLMKYENQTKEYKEKNSTYETPITMMKISELRKRQEERCKNWKKAIKQEQKEFDKILNKLKEYEICQIGVIQDYK